MPDGVILITGANGGLGTHVTETFLVAGYKVAGLSRGIGGGDFPHPNFAAFPVADASATEAQAAVAAMHDRWGRVDGLIHLAGGFAGGHPFTETGDHTFASMLEVNLMSFVHVVRAVLPGMQGQRSGRIVAIGSRAVVEPQAGLSAYAASKAALVSVVQTLARENRDSGITVNAVLPGTMDTPANRKAMPQADPAKWVQPGQVASLLLHLVSEHASQINGAVIPVYGGEL